MSRIGDALLRARETAAPSEDETERHEPLSRDPSVKDDVWAESPWTFSNEEVASEGQASALQLPAAGRPVPPTTITPVTAELPGVRARVVSSLPGGEETFAVFRGVNPAIEERLITSASALAEGVEQYRRVAATLHQAQVNRAMRVVMVTSAVLGEGKSLTSANLALTLSQSYRRHVLLVDADLRLPSLHDVFMVANTSGLSDGLRRSDASTFSTLEVSDTLTLLPAGQPDADPMAGLTSPRMSQLVQEARTKFDWVIIDTPPVTLMPDANLLATMADAVILVVDGSGTPFDVVRTAVDRIGRQRILGVVLNRADPVSMPGDYGSATQNRGRRR